jgi:hypothetical protein
MESESPPRTPAPEKDAPPREYIYLTDSARDFIYCSRCEGYLFEDMEKRAGHEAWIARITEHLTCEPAGGAE